MANVIERLNRPTLVISHNKTLAAQLYEEFKGFFPTTRSSTSSATTTTTSPRRTSPPADTYIEKDASINEEIDRLRLAATSALFERRDVMIVARVSCIYGLGDPEDYYGMLLLLEPGDERRHGRRAAAARRRCSTSATTSTSRRGTFRVRGDVVEIYPPYEEHAVRIEFFGDESSAITRIDPLTRQRARGRRTTRRHLPGQALRHAAARRWTRRSASIREELDERLGELDAAGKLLEAQRLAAAHAATTSR